MRGSLLQTRPRGAGLCHVVGLVLVVAATGGQEPEVIADFGLVEPEVRSSPLQVETDAGVVWFSESTRLWRRVADENRLVLHAAESIGEMLAFGDGALLFDLGFDRRAWVRDGSVEGTKPLTAWCYGSPFCVDIDVWTALP